ncbi:MAG: MBL fold metallo-hydrolase [Bauldia sp.]
MTLNLSFLGGAGTVAGSRYLLERNGDAILVDVGLFQGLKQHRLRNWARFQKPPADIGAVVLTHAHIDHSGYLPALVRDGFAGPVYGSAATVDLCGILLPDAAMLQEQDAAFANRHGFSKHKPALPLYTTADAEVALKRLRRMPFAKPVKLPGGAEITLRRAGHILGAASVECRWEGTTVVFSGDLGRPSDPIMLPPEPVAAADYLLVESTYGNRRHAAVDPTELLAAVVTATTQRGGTLLIPAFAVGRAQTLLYYLGRLARAGRLAVPVYLDSPMAIDAAALLAAHPDDHRLTPAECRDLAAVARYVRDPEGSKALTADPAPKVIISASGMATGGRVLHHLKRYAPDPKSTVLFAGFQAAGTRGEAMVSGATEIKIHGEYVPVRAEVKNLSELSAHADADEVMAWLKAFRRPPKRTFVVHGEPVAADILRHRIEEELGWAAEVPEHLSTVLL